MPIRIEPRQRIEPALIDRLTRDLACGERFGQFRVRSRQPAADRRKVGRGDREIVLDDEIGDLFEQCAARFGSAAGRRAFFRRIVGCGE
jgi:hypothetical protein